MEKLDYLFGSILLIILFGFLFGIGWASLKDKQQQPLTYNTIITNPYQGCVKGYCSMDGFKCLDEPNKPYTVDNNSCQCTDKGYACESS